MTQLDIGVFVSAETGELNEQKLTDWVTRYRIGSLFNTPFAGQAGRLVLFIAMLCIFHSKLQ